MLGDFVEEEPGGEALALQAALHVGEGERDGVHLAGVHQGAQLVQGQRRPGRRARGGALRRGALRRGGPGGGVLGHG